ncbi:heavy-metal-associated domain-containing protein [Candidatus Gottesmanbacteria bacterium]|nr:heavy-metal-associated domain-containing protein [Candidatus Gottesmanbacteria bacterium]
MQTIQILGLTCSACQKLISKKIKTIADVEAVTVELSGATAIKAQREISENEIKKVLTGTHYTVGGGK